MKTLNFSIQWHITDRCLNRCKHCYIDTCTNDVSFEQYRYVMDKLRRFEEHHDVIIPGFCITGGDPFCNVDFYKIVEDLSRRGKKVSILGIPERVTTDNMRFLSQNGISCYQVSLDGTQMDHDSIRGDGSYLRTIEAIKTLEQYDIPRTIMFTLGEHNRKDMFQLIKELDKEDVAADFTFDFLVEEGKAKVNCMEMISPECCESIFDEYFQQMQRHQKEKKRLRLRMKSPMMKAYALSKSEDGIGYSTILNRIDGCHCGISSCAILPNGDVYPCRRLPICIGNIYDEDFEEIILDNEFIKRFRRRDSYALCEDCQHFTVCRGCPAISYSFSGNPFGKTPYCFSKKTVPNGDALSKDNGEIDLLLNGVGQLDTVYTRRMISDYIKKNMQRSKENGN